MSSRSWLINHEPDFVQRSANLRLIHSSISDSSHATLAGPIFIDRGKHPLCMYR